MAGSMWFKSWKTKISSINLLSHVSNTGSGEPLVVIFLSIKAINYISYLNWWSGKSLYYIFALDNQQQDLI